MKDSTSAVAESGQAIHADLEGASIRELEVDEEMTKEKIERQLRQLYGILSNKYGAKTDEVKEIEIEVEFPAVSEVVTGHPDLVWLFPGDVAAVVDYKTGRGKGTPAVEGNSQLGTYALGVAKKYSRKRVVVAIIEPAVSHEPMWAEYTLDDLRSLYKHITGVIRYSKSKEGQCDFRPGKPQCDYCKFIHRCPAHQTNLTTVAALDNNIGRWRELAPEVRLEVYDRMKLAEKMINTLKRWFHAELNENPEAYGGRLRLKTRQGNREVVDAVNLWTAVNQSAGVTPEEFAECCRVTLGDLQKQVAKGLARRMADLPPDPATGNQPKPPRGAELKKQFDELVDPYVRRKADSQQFVREGDTEE